MNDPYAAVAVTQLAEQCAAGYGGACMALERRAEDADRYRLALRHILSELRAVGPGYPAPVADAVDIARTALGDD